MAHPVNMFDGRNGPGRLSRGRLLGLGAVAGVAGALSPLERAFAAWQATLPKTLRGTVTFQAWLYESSSKTNAASEKEPTILYRKYMQMHPGVKLVMVPPPSGDANVWILTHALAGKLPDLTQAATWPEIQKGFLTPITKYLFQPNPYIPGNKRWIDSLPKGFLNPFIGLDGNYYGFGADTAAIWIYYNPEHLNHIDMKPPTTWAEFMEACAKLKAKGITPYTQAGGIGWPISWWFLFAESSLWAAEFPPGTSLDVRGWVQAIKRGLLKKTDARTREAWQLMKRFSAYWQKGAVHGVSSAYHDFTSGKVTFMQEGSWEIGTLQGLLKGRFPLVALPVGYPVMTKVVSRYANGSLQSSGAAALNGILLYVTAHARDHLDVVVDFLRYYGSPQVMGPMALEVGEVPMVQGVGHLPPLIAAAKSVSEQPGLLMTPYYNADTRFTTTYDKMCQGYLAGAVPLDTALSTLEGIQQSVATRLAAQMHV